MSDRWPRWVFFCNYYFGTVILSNGTSQEIYCNELSFPFSDFCSEHMCGKYGCAEVKGYHDYQEGYDRLVFRTIDRWRSEHICFGVFNCRSCVICKTENRYRGRKVCRWCLKRECIAFGLLSTEYYFGMIPRDVIDMLMRYIFFTIEFVSVQYY